MRHLFVLPLLAVIVLPLTVFGAEAPCLGKLDNKDSEIIVISYDPAQPGKYLLAVTVSTSGKATVSPIKADYKLTEPDDPDPDPDLTERAEAIKKAALEVTADPKRAETAQGLAKACRQVSDWVEEGQISGQERIAKSVTVLLDMVLKRQDTAKQWQPVRDIISAEWAKLVNAGSADAGYAKYLDEVADGLEASAPKAEVDPEFWEFLMQLFEFFIKYILPLLIV